MAGASRSDGTTRMGRRDGTRGRVGTIVGDARVDERMARARAFARRAVVTVVRVV